PTFDVRRRISVGLKHGARRMNSPLPKRISACKTNCRGEFIRRCTGQPVTDEMRRTEEVWLDDAGTVGVRRRIGVSLKHGARRMNSPLPKRLSAQANPTVGANLFAVARASRQLMRCDGP